MKFVSLHHHTTFSYGDGFGTPASHVERAAELGYHAMAVTEHGNVSSHAQAEKAALKAGIKAIFGCEVYTAPIDMRETANQRKWHLTVLAMDQVGYRNLSELVSRSWDEGFYRWPTVTGPMLADHAEGLIVLSGCADSLLACTILGGKGIPEPAKPDIKAGIKVALKFKELLGDRYYLEVQQFPELKRARELNAIYQHISEKTGIPLVATADVHYPRPEDNDMQKVLHAASRGNGTVAEAEAGWEYDIRLTLPESDKFIIKRLTRTGLTGPQAEAAVARTSEIADRCNVTLPKSSQIRFPLPEGTPDAKTLIWQWIERGWKYRLARNAHMRKNKKAYRERLNYEMELIEFKDFVDYFLMLSDAVRFAKDQGIPVGPARGSAAASLTCYLLRIIEVDPMMFPTMMFERFIDAQRADLPDVDLDFSDDRRDEVRQRLIDVYGIERVANIGSFTKYRGKNSLDDVGRTHNIPPFEIETVKGLVLERSGGDSRFDASLEDTFEMFPQAASVLARYPDLSKAMRLEGNYKGMGVHSAGIVVSNEPITDTCAFYTRHDVGKAKKTLSVVAYDKKDAEYLGMLKADFLGLTTMGMIGLALDTIGMSIDELYQIPLDDPKTLAAFKRADVVGIFQFEGRATRLMTKDVQPDNFMEIADINALSRPGPLFSGASAQYVDVKHGRREPEHLHPIVDKYTKHSNYQIIYQEQVLATLREMGGFPGSVTGALRKVISLKLGEAQFNEWYPNFINGAKEHHGIDAKLADRVWRLMVTSATYSFNIAHCISYGMLAFWCMWLKVHHPAAFYAAQLTKMPKEKWAVLIRDAERHGVRILPPAIGVSGATWTPDVANNAVLAGYEQITGVGDVTSKDIAEFLATADPAEVERLGWPILIRVKGIGPVTVRKIQEWCDSSDPFGLNHARDTLAPIRNSIASGEIRLTHPIKQHSNDLEEADAGTHVSWMGIVKFRNYQDYLENQRSRTGRELDEIRAEMKRADLVTSCVLHCYDDGDEDVYLRFNRFSYPRFKKALESIRVGKDVVIITGKKTNGFGVSIAVDTLAVVDPD